MRSVVLQSLVAVLVASIRLAGAESLTSSVPEGWTLQPLAEGAAVGWQWPNLGSNFSYTIESSDVLGSAAAWRPVPASVWPIDSLSWIDPRLASGKARFYRAVAGPRSADRGKLLSVTSLPSLTPDGVRAVFAQLGLPLPVRHGVLLDKLLYETVNPFGVRTVASGLIVRPQNATNRSALVSYQHGTIISRSEVPSAFLGLERIIGVALSTDGYVTVLPDYVGLGDSPGLHPYVHAKSEATAVVDLLRAVRTFCASNAVPLNGQLFLMGYSEGGHATMAAHRELETFHTNEFAVTAVAPMAGPYDLSGVTLADFFSGRTMPNPYYLLYLLGAFESIYRFVPTLTELFVPPYDATLPPLLDGLHDSSEINQAMSGLPLLSLIKPEFLNALKSDPAHPFRIALQENDVYDWTPQAPVRLYHCGADEDVAFANSQTAYDTFVRRRVKDVQLLNPIPTAGHGECAPISLLAAKLWFDTLLVP